MPETKDNDRDAIVKKRKEVALRIADELASCDVKLIASLPDTWISELIRTFNTDERFSHFPVNREESAIALCSGAYIGGAGSAALMGASGFLTVVYALTKINYTYEIPLFMLITLRGGLGDYEKNHVSNGLYLERVIDAINMPYKILNEPGDIKSISRMYKQSRSFSRPMLVALTRDLMQGEG